LYGNRGGFTSYELFFATTEYKAAVALYCLQSPKTTWFYMDLGNCRATLVEVVARTYVFILTWT
jgi:hypothetical protein